MSQDSSTTSELTIDVTCTPRNRANLRRLKTSSVQSYQRWEKENELLYAIIEDESAWLTRLFPDAFLTPELFFYALEDGTILCRLANFIQEMADKYGVRTGKSVPGKKFAFHKAKRGSRESKLFHSRENVDKFLTWCRWHGIPEAVLFESNDAVLVDECRTGGREIVICLMEIARRSSKYEIQEVPQLIKLEREIEEEELSDVPSCANEQQGLAFDTSTVNINVGTQGDRSSPIDSDSGVESVFEGDPASPRLMEFLADETTPEPTKVIPKGKNMNKSERDKKPQRAIQKDERSLLESSQPKTELDEKVCKIAQEYNIKIVHRLKEGKYIILGKTMFVRMLNDHLLVRIGGGWDTLDHYVMTHASKSTEDTSSSLPSSTDHKSSGVWSKLDEKVKRRESQPNTTESPVVISKRERPDSSPSVYRLRDRVRKKLSVTEKDEKDISDAIRKIESSVTQTVISSHSLSFTSKTFFQLKNRFHKGRKRQLSRENIFDKKESNKMADQNIETFTPEEQQREAETKQESWSATTMLLESQKPAEPNEITESTKRALEEFSTSTSTVTEPLSSDFQFESGKEDFHAEIDYDSQQSLEYFAPGDDDFLSFGQQTKESTAQVETEKQSFPTIKSDDIFFNDNPRLFHSEAQQPEPVQDEEQSKVNKDELMLEEESRVEVPPADDQEPSKYLSSDTDFFAEIAQGIEFQPLGISPKAEQTEPDPFVLEPEENDAKSNIEDELEKLLQEPPAGNQADSFPEVAGDVQMETIKFSYESEEVESAPFVLLPQADRPEGHEHQEQPGEQVQQEQPGEQVQEGNEERAPEISMEYTGGVSNEPEPEFDLLPAEVTGGSDVALEIETPLEDVQSSKTAVKDVGYMISQKEDKEKNEVVVQNMFAIAKGEELEDNGLQAQITKTELLIPVDKDVLQKDEEEFKDSECPAQIDDYAHDSKNEEQTLPEILNVVESEEKTDEKESLANIVNVEKSSKEETIIAQVTEMEPPALSQNVEEPKAEQNEAKDVPPDKNTAPVSQKKQAKKVPGTSKKKHEKSVTTATSKNITESKKEDHKAERPKGSATRPTASKTAKTTSATTALKAKTVPAASTARSTSAIKRPPSAPNAKSGNGISKPTGPKMPANGASKAGTKTTSKSSQLQNPLGAGNLRPTARDKKAPPSSGTQKAESKSRPRSAVSTTSTDKADGKVESHQPLSTKTKPLSGTTRTTVKKTTTSTTKSTIGPASVSEVYKTTVTTSKGGITSSTSTTTKKSTKPGGRTKDFKETTPHQKASARNKASEMRSGMHGKPGSASTKTKPPSASTIERAGSAMTKEKPGSERPKSPTKRAPKKLAAAKCEETKAPVEEKSASEPAAITAPIVPGASDVITPDGITDTKDDVTRVIQHTEVVEDDGETKIVHTQEVTETVTENGEQQIVTTEETVVESSEYPSKIIN